MSREEIRAGCDVLFSPGQVIEVRALGDQGTFSGYYNDLDKLAADAEALDSTPQFKGIYFTLNPVNPALLARKVNRISKQGKTDASTSDQDIARRVWFPVDIDPTRPAGISSSNAEHGEALAKAAKIKGFLSEMGWPAPVMADSGNGAHLLYRVNLPNDKESTELVKDCLTALSQLFTNSQSSVDTANHNASRIWKLYGTVSRKGDHTEDRPHRRSELLEVPEELIPVPVSDLMLLASLKKTDESSKGSISSTSKNDTTGSIDLGDWLTSHGLGYEEKPYSGGRLFVLDDCPFSGAHKDGAYAIQFSSGAIFAGCHHDSCGGGTQRWTELREMYEGAREGAAKRRPSRMTSEEYDQKRRQDAREKAQAKNKYYGNVPEEVKTAIGDALGCPPIKEGESDRINHTAEAARILREGDPVQYILDSFRTDHEGDEIVARCLIMSFASRAVINSNGLHVLVTGESGKGKSHAFDTMLQHIPPTSRLDGRLSDKALFYTEGITPGTAICLDDIGLSEQMQETLKGVTTSFKKPFLYRTVNKDRKGQTCVIPERCVWWVAKVEGSGDDQVWNRMLTCWIDDSREQDDKVLIRELTAAAQLPGTNEGVRDEILICHHIWSQLLPAYVVIPYAEKIRFSSSSNRRNPGMLLDLIKSVAILHQYQRERETISKTTVVYATAQDFKQACQIYQALNGVSGGQASKLTRSEAELVRLIVATGRTEFSMIDLQLLSERSYNSVRKLLHGSSSHQSHYSGLLEKCPAISLLDRTDVTEGGDVSRRQRVYTWDHEQYKAWASGGGCWLDRNDNDSTDGDDSGRWRKDGGSVPLSNETQSDTEIENNNNNNSFSTSWRKDEHVQSVQEPARTYYSAPEISATSAITDQNQTSDSFAPGDSPSDKIFDSGNDPLSPATPPLLPLSEIDPSDYHQIDGVWSGPCAVCGSKWVQYVERVTPQMKKEGRFSTRKICQKCRDKARNEISKTFTILPGVLNIAGMVPTNTPRGKCKVCHQNGITWEDPETHDGLCEICHSLAQLQQGATA